MAIKVIDNNIKIKVCNDYVKGLTNTEIAKIYNISSSSVKKILRINNIKREKRSVDVELNICNDYIGGVSKTDIVKKYPVSYHTITAILKKHNIKKINQNNSICDDYIKGSAKKEISQKYNISLYYVRKVLKENNINERINFSEIQVCDDYKCGLFMEDIAIKYNIGRKKVSKILKKYNISVYERKTSQISEDIICNEYLGHLNIEQISEKYNITTYYIYKILEKNKIGLKGYRISKKGYTFNEDFFENIDTKEKAYILGWLYGDGCLHKRPDEITSTCISLGVQEPDAYILEKIAKIMGNTKPLYFLPKSQETHQNKIAFAIYSNKMAKDLIDLGLDYRKTYSLRFAIFLNKEFYGSFFRGVFDSDGCMYVGKDSVSWSICGHLDFCNDLCSFLNFINIRCNVIRDTGVTGIPFGKVKIQNLVNLQKIYNFLYADSDDLFLTRKRDKFLQLNFKKMEDYNAEIETIKQMHFDNGLKISEIATKLNRTYQNIWGKIKSIKNQTSKWMKS